MKSKTYLGFWLLTFFSVCWCKDLVPVLVWNVNEARTFIPPVSALQEIPYAAFSTKYLESFNSENIIAFIQDALSIEDLSSHSGEFRNIAEWTDEHHSLYLPSVNGPARLVHDLPQKGYNVITLEPRTSVAELQLVKGEKNLVIVKLPSTITNPSRSQALRKTSEIIENVIAKVGGMANFTFVYTGEKPSVFPVTGKKHLRVSRSLQQFEEPASRPVGYHSCQCVILYLRNNVTLYFVQHENDTLPVELSEESTNSTSVCHCTNEVSSITVLYKDPVLNGINLAINKLNIEFKFEKSGSRHWTVEGVDIFVQEKNSKQSDIHLYPVGEVDTVPLGKSFSCSKKISFRANATDVGPITQITISGVQVEPFIVNSTERFGDAWDCVGFFSIPIWTGLFAMFIATVILLLGVYMLAEVKTMDRFDDPKGKTIIIPTSE